MRGHEDADVHADGFVSTDTLDLAFFQNAQELGLHGDGHVADFVKKQSAAIGLLEFPEMFGGRAGERAFFVAEELRLDEFGGNGGAVESDERVFVARGFLVNGARDKLFAGASLAEDADASFAGGDAVDLS